ncbi:hypothetical protein CPB85DRAFT_195262 [Mucidula mucida]|nr:hypothetical protein CPB85DRAFT_195262 [Mucidula mucida]
MPSRSLFKPGLSGALFDALSFPAMPPTASLLMVPWISLTDFNVTLYQWRIGSCTQRFGAGFFKLRHTFFLVLTLVDSNGKKYEGSTSARKANHWEYDRITLPNKPHAKITFNVYRSRWKGIPLLYERIAAGEVTIENLDNGEGAFLSLHYIPLMGNNAQSHAGEIGLSEVSDSKEETIPLKLKFFVERGQALIHRSRIVTLRKDDGDFGLKYQQRHTDSLVYSCVIAMW